MLTFTASSGQIILRLLKYTMTPNALRTTTTKIPTTASNLKKVVKIIVS